MLTADKMKCAYLEDGRHPLIVVNGRSVVKF